MLFDRKCRRPSWKIFPSSPRRQLQPQSGVYRAELGCIFNSIAKFTSKASTFLTSHCSTAAESGSLRNCHFLHSALTNFEIKQKVDSVLIRKITVPMPSYTTPDVILPSVSRIRVSKSFQISKVASQSSRTTTMRSPIQELKWSRPFQIK